MVPVQILGLHLDQASGTSIVLLGEIGEVTRVLPIFIGPAEANAIAIGLAAIQTPRPGTHDLLIEVMHTGGLHLIAVEVTELREQTFVADLVITSPEGEQRVSARPSDAIALAVRCQVPIVVSAVVLDQAAVRVEHEADQPFDDDEVDQIVEEFRDFLAGTEPADFQTDHPPRHQSTTEGDPEHPEEADGTPG